MLEVVRIPVLNDNYVWLLHDDASKETVVVDPAVAGPVLEAAQQRVRREAHQRSAPKPRQVRAVALS